MKKPLILINFFLLALFAWSPPPARAASYNFSQPLICATSIAANSTNSTPGTAYNFAVDQVAQSVTLYICASGVAATTNGAFSVVFSRSRGDGKWESVANSELVLSMSSMGATTNVVVDWINLTGTKAIRVSEIRNTFSGPVSNIVVNAEIKCDK